METNYLGGFDINLHDVKEHYMRREKVSNQLRKLLESGSENNYVELAVGKRWLRLLGQYFQFYKWKPYYLVPTPL